MKKLFRSETKFKKLKKLLNLSMKEKNYLNKKPQLMRNLSK